MTAVAEVLLEGLNENAVDFRDNYDGTLQEPEVLPAALPNLLANGSSGIAVGMATNIPPHNVDELIAACLHLIKTPDARDETLLNYVQGPDFPTGGVIVEPRESMAETYRTGRGAFHAQLYRLGVSGERLWRPAKDVPAKLVVQEDQREPPLRFLRPAVQCAPCCAIHEWPEFLADQRIEIGVCAEPAVQAAVDGRLVHGAVTEPEVEYAADVWVAHRPEYKRAEARLLQTELLFDRLAADREDGVLVLRRPELWPDVVG